MKIYLNLVKNVFLTYEFENIDINILKKIEKPIYPDIKYLEIIQDKFTQKNF